MILSIILRFLSSQEVEGLQKYKYIDIYFYHLTEYMVKKTPYLFDCI